MIFKIIWSAGAAIGWGLLAVMLVTGRVDVVTRWLAGLACIYVAIDCLMNALTEAAK